MCYKNQTKLLYSGSYHVTSGIGGIKDVVYLKHVGTERFRLVVKSTSDVTPTARDL